MMTLYEAHDCWKCVEVREELDALGIPYEMVQTRGNADAKKVLLAAQGDPVTVPMLVDGTLAVWDRRRILAYLQQTYGSSTDWDPWQEMSTIRGDSCTLDGTCTDAHQQARVGAVEAPARA